MIDILDIFNDKIGADRRNNPFYKNSLSQYHFRLFGKDKVHPSGSVLKKATCELISTCQRQYANILLRQLENDLACRCNAATFLEVPPESLPSEKRNYSDKLSVLNVETSRTTRLTYRALPWKFNKVLLSNLNIQSTPVR